MPQQILHRSSCVLDNSEHVANDPTPLRDFLLRQAGLEGMACVLYGMAGLIVSDVRQTTTGSATTLGHWSSICLLYTSDAADDTPC
eukprot:5876488-Amphidinium_carterae.1